MKDKEPDLPAQETSETGRRYGRDAQLLRLMYGANIDDPRAQLASDGVTTVLVTPVEAAQRHARTILAANPASAELLRSAGIEIPEDGTSDGLQSRL